MNIIEHDEGRHQFSTEVDGYRAELSYTLSGRVMSIMHTGVPSAIGGKGVAAQLMKAAATTAHSKGWSINAVCSYAAVYLARHPEASFPAGDFPLVGGSS